MLADLNPERGAEAKREIEASFNRRAVFVHCDVAAKKTSTRWCVAPSKNSAASTVCSRRPAYRTRNTSAAKCATRSEDPTANHLINKSVADWERVLKINLTGVMLTDRAVARHMIAKRHQRQHHQYRVGRRARARCPARPTTTCLKPASKC